MPTWVIAALLFIDLGMGSYSLDNRNYAVSSSYPYLGNISADSLVIVVNIPERMLYLYEKDTAWHRIPISIFPVGIGTKRFQTPQVSGHIMTKRINPAWFAPNRKWAGSAAGTVVSWNSRGNPFRALNETGVVEGYFMGVAPSIGLHSTRDSASIGGLASHGCVRMRLQDVRWLHHNIPRGVPVHLVYHLYPLRRFNLHEAYISSVEDIYGRAQNHDKRKENLRNSLAFHGLSIEHIPESTITAVLEGQRHYLYMPFR